MRAPKTLLAAVFFLLAGPGTSGAGVAWNAGDDRPIPEPAEDEEGDFLWWDGTWSMTFYQFGKVLDLGRFARSTGERLGWVRPVEAWNRNALDEALNSTWFTNRHHLERLDEEELRRGPNLGPAPSREGPLVIRSGKTLGQSPGFLLEDENGNRFLVKFDPPEIPEMATGAEMVSSKILHALGWNVPEYHLFDLDSARLEVGPGATTRDEYRRKRPMTAVDVERVLARASRQPDGRIRAIASRLIPGTAKGPFRTLGIRPDDPNDRVPHQHRRELRGLRVVAAWINYTDARRGNFFDAFVNEPDDPPGHGRLVHYLLDFSSTLGSGNLEYKDPKDGNEYFVDPPVIFRSLVSLGFWVKPWEDDPPVQHAPLGFFEASTFDPVRWRTRYPNPLFDHATLLDEFWGARLVSSFTDEDLKIVVGVGEWSDAGTGEALFRILRERRDRIASTWFRSDRINPLENFRVSDGRLRFDDLGVRNRLVPVARARYRTRVGEGSWTESALPEVALPDAAGESTTIEIVTRHAPATSWSPPVHVTLRTVEGEGPAVVGLERETR